MTRISFRLFIIALFGGVLGAIFIFFIFSDRSSNASLSKYYTQVPKTDIDSASLSTSSLGLWEKIVAKLSPSLVGIQVFKDNKIVRQGSGIVVSSDGLVVTTTDLLISDAIYQISYDDKILKGLVMAKDYKFNLILLKVSGLNSSIADLDKSADYKSGQEILLIGKLFDLSKPISASQKGTISYITNKTIILDTTLSSYLYGFGVADTKGKFRGITYVRNGKVNLVKAELIETFFNYYIEKDN